MKSIARLLLCVVVLALAGSTGAQSRGDDARRILDGPEYRGYRVERAEYESRSRRAGEGGGDAGRSDDGSDFRRKGEAGPPRRSSSERSSGSSLSMPSWLGSLFTVVMWVLVIGAGVVALYFIIKALLGINWTRRARESSKTTEGAKAKAKSSPDEPAPPEPLREFEDALAAAQRDYEQALRDGDWARAALLSYRIFWLKAGWRGCVEETDVRTWRDALRMVRAPETRTRVRELLGLVERVRYGEHVPAQPEFEAWKARLDTVEPKGVLQ